MTTAAAGEVWQAKIHGRQEAQECLNVLHFGTVMGDNNVELRLLQALLNCVVTSLLPGLHTSYRLERVTAMRVSPTVGPELEVVPDPTGVIQGSIAGDALPSFTSCVLSIRANAGGRAGRGRMFIPGLPESAVSGSFIGPESPYWLAMIAFAACLLSSFKHFEDIPSTNEWWFGVMSRKIGGVKPPFLAAGFSHVMSITPKAAVATTRSRKVGHGS